MFSAIQALRFDAPAIKKLRPMGSEMMPTMMNGHANMLNSAADDSLYGIDPMSAASNLKRSPAMSAAAPSPVKMPPRMRNFK